MQNLNTENDDDNDSIPSFLNYNNFNANKDWKDALISNLHSKIEFLKSEIKEKNKLLTLLINALVNGNNSNDYETNQSLITVL